MGTMRGLLMALFTMELPGFAAANRADSAHARKTKTATKTKTL